MDGPQAVAGGDDQVTIGTTTAFPQYALLWSQKWATAFRKLPPAPETTVPPAWGTTPACPIHSAGRHACCCAGPHLPHRGPPRRARRGGAGRTRRPARHAAPVPQPPVGSDVRAIARAQPLPHRRHGGRRCVLEERTPGATNRRIRPCGLHPAWAQVLCQEQAHGHHGGRHEALLCIEPLGRCIAVIGEQCHSLTALRA